MSRTKVAEGDALTFIAPAGGVISGNAYLIGDIVVVATTTVAATLPFAGVCVGAHRLPKTAAQAVTQGQALYWDNVGFLVTTTVGANKKLGHAAAPALAVDTTVVVRLQPI